MGKPSVFISYSHKDERWKDRLVTQLRVLESEGLLELWDDQRIDAGEDWLAAILKAIDEGSIAVLLVSANSLTSKFIMHEEVPRLLQRRENAGMRIFPIIIEPCVWEAVDWLRKVELRPKDLRPLSSRRKSTSDAKLAEIAREIHLLLQKGQPSNSDPLAPIAHDKVDISQSPTEGILVGQKEETTLPHYPENRRAAGNIGKTGAQEKPVVKLGIRKRRRRLTLRLTILMTGVCGLLLSTLFISRAVSFYRNHFTLDDAAQDYIDGDSYRKWNPKKEICEKEIDGNKLQGICFTEDEVVLFKDTVREREFNYYQNFTAVFDLRFTNGKGGAWVVRAQDFENYYLFVWAPTGPPEESSSLALYTRGNGKLSHIQSVSVPEKIDHPNDSFKITLTVQGNQFTHTIQRLNGDDKEPHMLDPLIDGKKKYRYGGVGFRAFNGAQMLLQYFAVEPSK